MWWTHAPQLSWHRATSPRDIIETMSDEPDSIQDNEKSKSRPKVIFESGKKSSQRRNFSEFQLRQMKQGQATPIIAHNQTPNPLDYSVLLYCPPLDRSDSQYSVKPICQPMSETLPHRPWRHTPAVAGPRFDSFTTSSSSSCCQRSDSRCSCRQLQLKVVDCTKVEPIYDRVVSWLEALPPHLIKLLSISICISFELFQNQGKLLKCIKICHIWFLVCKLIDQKHSYQIKIMLHNVSYGWTC